MVEREAGGKGVGGRNPLYIGNPKIQSLQQFLHCSGTTAYDPSAIGIHGYAAETLASGTTGGMSGSTNYIE